MQRFILTVALWSTAAVAAGQHAGVSLLAPLAAVAPEARVTVTLVRLNATAGPVTIDPPAVIRGRLVAGNRTWDVVLRSVTTPAATTLAPGTFTSHPYTVAMPAAAQGRVVLEISDPGPARAVLDVSPPAPKPGAVVAAASSGAPMIAQFQRAFTGHFSPLEPIYFLFGPDKPAAKFQFSFKYLLFGDGAAATPPRPSLRGLYFGYTQRSLWDITAQSSPFYDTSYMPELLYESLAPGGRAESHGGYHWLGYQTAVHHESNGRAGDFSRSANTVYLRPMWGFGRPAGWWLVVAPKMFFYVGGLSDNPDLARYRGYSELSLTITRHNRLSLALTGRIGSHWDRGSIQADLTYPLQAPVGGFATFVLLQYFNGYGESLLDYRQRSSTARLGFSLVR